MAKKMKDKSKEEMLTDMLNYHVSKGNISKDRVSGKHKGKLLKLLK